MSRGSDKGVPVVSVGPVSLRPVFPESHRRGRGRFLCPGPRPPLETGVMGFPDTGPRPCRPEEALPRLEPVPTGGGRPGPVGAPAVVRDERHPSPTGWICAGDPPVLALPSRTQPPRTFSSRWRWVDCCTFRVSSARHAPGARRACYDSMFISRYRCQVFFLDHNRFHLSRGTSCVRVLPGRFKTS